MGLLSGLEDTAEYYGPYTETEPVATSVPEPNVSVDIVPGCNILNQFSIANYTGAIPCETSASAPCQVRRCLLANLHRMLHS